MTQVIDHMSDADFVQKIADILSAAELRDEQAFEEFGARGWMFTDQQLATIGFVRAINVVITCCFRVIAYDLQRPGRLPLGDLPYMYARSSIINIVRFFKANRNVLDWNDEMPFQAVCDLCARTGDIIDHAKTPPPQPVRTSQPRKAAPCSVAYAGHKG